MWNLDTGVCTQTFSGHTMSVHAISADWNRRRVLSGALDCKIKLWDVDTGSCDWSIDVPDHKVHEIVADWERGQALTGGGDCIKLWDVFSGMEVRRFAGEGKSMKHAQSRSFAVNWMRRMVLTDSFDTACNLNTLRLWELDTSRCIMSFMGPFGFVWSVAVDWENKEVMTSGEQGLQLWSLGSGASIQLGKGLAADTGDHRAVVLSNCSA